MDENPNGGAGQQKTDHEIIVMDNRLVFLDTIARGDVIRYLKGTRTLYPVGTIILGKNMQLGNLGTLHPDKSGQKIYIFFILPFNKILSDGSINLCFEFFYILTQPEGDETIQRQIPGGFQILRNLLRNESSPVTDMFFSGVLGVEVFAGYTVNLIKIAFWQPITDSVDDPGQDILFI